MFQSTALIFAFFLTFSAYAGSKEPTYGELLKKIKPSLLHVIPTEEADLKRMPLGCTGFYIKPELADDRLMI
ncbi:MAG: hypothetical protein IT286_01595, partial [Proteobacteria bacterium]|nr:hypothetical protein [Pseudomonadota bacterium]